MSKSPITWNEVFRSKSAQLAPAPEVTGLTALNGKAAQPPR